MVSVVFVLRPPTRLKFRTSELLQYHPRASLTQIESLASSQISDRVRVVETFHHLTSVLLKTGQILLQVVAAWTEAGLAELKAFGILVLTNSRR